MTIFPRLNQARHALALAQGSAARLNAEVHVLASLAWGRRTRMADMAAENLKLHRANADLRIAFDRIDRLARAAGLDTHLPPIDEPVVVNDASGMHDCGHPLWNHDMFGCQYQDHGCPCHVNVWLTGHQPTQQLVPRPGQPRECTRCSATTTNMHECDTCQTQGDYAYARRSDQ